MMKLRCTDKTVCVYYQYKRHPSEKVRWNQENAFYVHINIEMLTIYQYNLILCVMREAQLNSNSVLLIVGKLTADIVNYANSITKGDPSIMGCSALFLSCQTAC